MFSLAPYLKPPKSLEIILPYFQNIYWTTVEGSREFWNPKDLQRLFKVGEIINVVFERYGKRREAELKIKTETSYSLSFMEEQSKDLTEKKKQNRALWLSAKE